MVDFPDGYKMQASPDSDLFQSIPITPFCFQKSLTVAAGSSGSMISVFPSDELIYVLREVRAVNTTNAKIGLLPYLFNISIGRYFGSGQAQALFNGPYDLVFVYGDLFHVIVSNYESSSKAIEVTARFDIVLKPVNIGLRPVVTWDVDPASPTHGVAAAFTCSATNTPLSYLWSFGDGKYSTEQNTTHVYASAGDYDISLTVFNRHGSEYSSGQVHVS